MESKKNFSFLLWKIFILRILNDFSARKQPSASSATRDLDNLMSSLSEFKVILKCYFVSFVLYERFSVLFFYRIFLKVNTTTTSRSFVEPQTGAVGGMSSSNNEPPYARPVRSPRTVHQTPAAAAVSDTTQLDSILGNLSSDLSKHGITTIPKGDCAACQKSIIGQVSLFFPSIYNSCKLFFFLVDERCFEEKFVSPKNFLSFSTEKRKTYILRYV